MAWDFAKLKEELRATEQRHGSRSSSEPAAGAVDIHTHVLPGVDDGAPDLDASLEMLRSAHESGTRTVVLTPHLYHRSFDNWDEGALRRRFASFQEQIWQLSVGEGEFLREMDLRFGAENVLSTELLGAVQRSEVLTLGASRHVLVELSEELPAVAVESALHQLLDAGYVPVLAHVERYCRRDPSDALLKRLVRAGCVGQVNLGSLHKGSPWFDDAVRLLTRGLAPVVASDGHDTSLRPIGLGSNDLDPGLRSHVETGTTFYARRVVESE